MKDTETAYRTLLVSNDAVSRSLLDTAGWVAAQKLHQLQKLLIDSSQIDMLANKISPLIERKVEDLKHSEKISASIFGADKLEGLLQKTAQLDTIQRYLKLFNEREQQLLNTRLDKLQYTLDVQRKIRYVSLLLIALTSLIALISLIRKQKQNDALIEELNAPNNTLEHKVYERTQELEKKSTLAEKLNRDLHDNFHTLELFYKAIQIKKVKAEDTVREIEFLYDNATCGYHSLAQDGTIIRMNKTELAWLGYSLDEVVNVKKLSDIIIEEEVESFTQNFKRFLDQGSIKNMKHHFKRKDGSVFPIILNATAIFNTKGEYVMSRATVIDITEQEESAEKLLDANKKLILLNEEKNNFLGMAAHDLKSPLNGILGLINLIKGSSERLSTQQQEYIRYIEGACTSMKTMVTNLLDINRIEQGLNTVEPTRFALATVLDTQMRIAKEHADKKGIRISLENNNNEITLTTDVNAFMRIVDNLLSNALKFSPPNKNVWIKVSAFDNHVQIDFTDQGPGIRPDEMNLLFGKFKKLSNKPTGGESSTGLGLSIVRELVLLLKGKIYVHSEVDKGSTFTIELPYSIISQEVAYAKN
ncbi:sensor histidine kinase [Pseudochryseolinea flava]|uniref:sensor histidine kinase n=1 Tax=Pseudochryseolinea flava TaxID=2059302 RepID=UPI001057D929|nr:PAS domain-containing sensor histidine kinase [Pseudochryseolinea flava]